MFEVVRDWNYATAIICNESAFILRSTPRAPHRYSLKALSSLLAEKYFIESAFFVAVALTRHRRGAQTRITTSVSPDAQRAQHRCTRVHRQKQKDATGGPECQPTKCVIEFADRPC